MIKIHPEKTDNIVPSVDVVPDAPAVASVSASEISDPKDIPTPVAKELGAVVTELSIDPSEQELIVTQRVDEAIQLMGDCWFSAKRADETFRDFEANFLSNPEYENYLPQILDQLLSSQRIVIRHGVLDRALDVLIKKMGVSAIYENLIRSEHGAVVITRNFDIFDGLDRGDYQRIAQKLINDGDGDVLVSKLEKFEGLGNDKELAKRVISSGHSKAVAQFAEKFNGLDQEVADLLIANGQGYKVYEKREYYSGIEPQTEKVEKYIKEYFSVAHASQEGDVANKLLAKNVSHLLYLESKHPGCTDILIYDLGIKELGRYPEELLVDQLTYQNDKDTPYGIVVYPLSDNNGAFHQDLEVLRESYKQLQDLGYHLRILPEADGLRSIASSLIKLNRKYGNNQKISFAFVAGHGGKHRIRFGNDARTPYALSSAYLFGEGVQRALGSDFFMDNYPIILLSCSTGKLGGIAQRMSKITNGEVIAPDVPTSPRKIEVSKDGSGHLHFEVSYYENEDIDQRYFRGEKIS